MKKASEDAIRSAFQTALGEMPAVSDLPQEEHWEYRRTSTGGWSGRTVLKPSFISLLIARHNLIEIGAPIEAALKEDYPKHLQLVGTRLSAGALQPSSIVFSLVSEAHKRFGTFTLTRDQIDSILADVSRFFDRRTVRLRLSAPVLNLYGRVDAPPVMFPGGITLRPMTDQECTEFYGGNAIYQFRQRPIAVPNFVFVQEIETEKIVGSNESMSADPVVKPFQEALDLCFLALATFKDAGAVGYDGIRVSPGEFALGPGFGGIQLFGNEHVPGGHYELAPEETASLEAHAKLFAEIHPSLEMASHRLVDSGRRTKPRDALVDAVIGLESILLANISERAELRFRFSLHYACLFPQEERRSAFHTARDLYDVRSTIAHGGSVKEKVKIDGELVSLADAAARGRSVLRVTISKFLPNSKHPEFMEHDYWQTKELGL